MFEVLKNKMLLEESKKIEKDSLYLVTDDIDDDEELSDYVLDGENGDEDSEISELLEKIPEDDINNDDDLESEMAILESVLDDNDDTIDETTTTEVANSEGPFEYLFTDIDELDL